MASGKGREDIREMKLRTDGWGNLLTGLGTANVDKKQSTVFNVNSLIDRSTLSYLYMQDGLAKKIVSLPAGDMVREWFTVDGDPDGDIIKRLELLKTKSMFEKALNWSRLFGGSVLFMGIDDGQSDPILPLNENNIRSISFLKEYDRHHAVKYEYYKDKTQEKYGEVEIYDIYPEQGASFRVHESRILRFDGEMIPQDFASNVDHWGLSVLESVYSRLRGIGETYLDIEHIISEFIIGVLKIENLAELIASGEEQQIKTRLNLIDLSKHIINTVLLDSTEDMQRVSSTVTGLPDLISKMEQALSAVCGIPQTLLFGDSPSGLNATGESDLRIYYDKISTAQETKMSDNLNRLISLILMEKGSNISVENDWKINFTSLWQPTEKELAETRKIQSETDTKYFEIGVLSANEIRESRFGGNGYSSDTILGESDMMEAENVDPEGDE